MHYFACFLKIIVKFVFPQKFIVRFERTDDVLKSWDTLGKKFVLDSNNSTTNLHIFNLALFEYSIYVAIFCNLNNSNSAKVERFTES